MAESTAGWGRPGTLRAAFRTPEEAAQAASRLRDQGISDDIIVINDEDDRQRMLLRLQQHESDRAVPVVGSNLFTPAQAKGAALWTAIGTVTGGVVVGCLGLVMTLGDYSRAASIGLFALVGGLAGASAGFTYGGGRQPEVDGELRDPSPDVTVTVRPRDADEAAAAIRIIDESAAADAEYETTRDDPAANGHGAAPPPRRARRRTGAVLPTDHDG